MVICRKYKRRGMSWTKRRAENLLRLRLLVLNDKRETYWKRRRDGDI